MLSWSAILPRLAGVVESASRRDKMKATAIKWEEHLLIQANHLSLLPWTRSRLVLCPPRQPQPRPHPLSLVI
jgi:hypothetical protein